MILFLRFSAVGGAGFVVDAGILLFLIHIFGADPIAARLLSFGAAVAITFEFNRRWAFGGVSHGPARIAFAAYLGVQSIGLLCNLIVYTALILALPATVITPPLCVAFASAIALLVNYSGVRRLVFQNKAK